MVHYPNERPVRRVHAGNNTDRTTGSLFISPAATPRLIRTTRSDDLDLRRPRPLTRLVSELIATRAHGPPR
jgi:hypothetical protein